MAFQKLVGRNDAEKILSDVIDVINHGSIATIEYLTEERLKK